ncbi:MAG: hypothetical protein COA94_00020 [Rickettsiales bacterium]|nr:MAG: hypothetical protein COA94_00020 [Rickettsiales bacterium]
MKFSHLSRIYSTDSIAIGQTITIEGEDFHYLKSVIRLKLGATFRMFNENDGEFMLKITQIGRSSIIANVESLLRLPALQKDLTLAICVIKQDRMIEAIKAAVQIGVTRIVPVISERVQHRQNKRDKILKSIIQSTEQSERFKPAEFTEEITLKELCAMDDIEQIIWANETESEGVTIKNIKQIKGRPCVLIGCEGGFSDAEIQMLKSHDHVQSVSLGHSVLRAEIAAIYALSCTSMMRGVND